MNQSQLTTSRPRTAASRSRVTRALLTCGTVAGPLYLGVAAIQVLVRDGFDLRRHAISVLSNGDLGWVQIANFVVTGILVVGAAAGMRRAMRGGRGGTWGPLLVGVYGAGVIASGVFVADPADGFPPGTPPGMPEQVSWHGGLHLLAGGVAFLAVVVATFVFAHRFADRAQRGWASYSVATGAAFLATWLALVATAGTEPIVNLAFAAGVVAAWVWVTAVAAHLRR